MFLLESIKRSPNRVDYEYSYPKAISKYFTNKKLYLKTDVDLSTVPDEILTIPLLGNILPVSWFVGFDVKVSRLDKTFYDAAQELKTQFAVYYPQINEKSSELIVDELIDFKEQESTKTAMLFSGGVDAYTTLLRHYEEQPDLITIRGADIAIEDERQWENVVAYNTSTEAIKANAKYSIEINLREFLTYEIESLLEGQGWWGRVQHGMALTTAVAPLAYIKEYAKVYFASTYARKSDYEFVIWGSMPELDNLIRWGNTQVMHDAEELTRQEKINFIVNKSKAIEKYPELRVCYSEFKDGLNCSICEKCFRTIIALMIDGENPKKYGLEMKEDFFERIEKRIVGGFANKGNRLFWKEIYDESRLKEGRYYEFALYAKEYASLFEVLRQSLEKPLQKQSTWTRWKYRIIGSFPNTFESYLKIRRKFI